MTWWTFVIGPTVGCLIAIADEIAAALFVDEDWRVVDGGRR